MQRELLSMGVAGNRWEKGVPMERRGARKWSGTRSRRGGYTCMQTDKGIPGALWIAGGVGAVRAVMVVVKDEEEEEGEEGEEKGGEDEEEMAEKKKTEEEEKYE